MCEALSSASVPTCLLWPRYDWQFFFMSSPLISEPLLLFYFFLKMIGVAGHASICPCCFCQLMVKKVAKVNHPAPDHMERAETAADKHARSSLFWDSAEPQVIMRDGHKMKEWHDRYLQANSGMQTAMREAGHASAGGLVSVFGPAYVGIIHVEYGHAMGTLPPPAFFSLTHAISPLSFFLFCLRSGRNRQDYRHVAGRCLQDSGDTQRLHCSHTCGCRSIALIVPQV